MKMFELVRSGRVLTLCNLMLVGLGLGSPSHGAEEQDALSLQLVTFNIRYQTSGDKGPRNWEQRLPVALKAVAKMNPDVMGVQEALDGQLRELQKGMPSYAVFGVGRDDGKRRGEHVSIFYRKDRFKRDESESGHFWLSDTPAKVASSSWGNGITRMCTWARLVDQKSGRGFYVFNTHWDHRAQGSREQAARLIAQKIDQRKYLTEPVVLMGDFNAVEQNPAIRYLTGESTKLTGSEKEEQWVNSLLDVFQKLHPEQKNRSTFNQWKGSKEGMVKIDHVFVSSKARLLEAEIVYDHEGDVYSSDHYPVRVKIVFP